MGKHFHKDILFTSGVDKIMICQALNGFNKYKQVFNKYKHTGNSIKFGALGIHISVFYINFLGFFVFMLTFKAQSRIYSGWHSKKKKKKKNYFQ